MRMYFNVAREFEEQESHLMITFLLPNSNNSKRTMAMLAKDHETHYLEFTSNMCILFDNVHATIFTFTFVGSRCLDMFNEQR
jgi:hypothetical protein